MIIIIIICIMMVVKWWWRPYDDEHILIILVALPVFTTQNNYLQTGFLSYVIKCWTSSSVKGFGGWTQWQGGGRGAKGVKDWGVILLAFHAHSEHYAHHHQSKTAPFQSSEQRNMKFHCRMQNTQLCLCVRVYVCTYTCTCEHMYICTRHITVKFRACTVYTTCSAGYFTKVLK